MSKRLSMEESLKQGASDILVKALLGGLEGLTKEIFKNLDWSKFSLKNLFASPKAKQDPYLPAVRANIELLGTFHSMREMIPRLDTIVAETQCDELKASCEALAESQRRTSEEEVRDCLRDLHDMAVAGSQAAGAVLICFATYGLDYFKRSYIAGTNDSYQLQSPTAIRFRIHLED